MKYKTIHFDTIDSTNAYLKREHNCLDSFTFVSSDYQTNGKGREDRVWTSDQSSNLLFSLLIKENNLLNLFSYISLGAAYVIAEYLEDLGLKDVSIKWPNDVYIGDKKICGILLEGSLSDYLVLGIGLNVNQIEFPDDLRRPATSIRCELNRIIELDLLKNNIFSNLYNFIVDIETSKRSAYEFLKTHNYLLNKIVKVDSVVGVVQSIDKSFRLVVINGDGKHVLSSKEIEIL